MIRFSRPENYTYADVMGSIPGPGTCDRQRLGQELHLWHYSQKCVGLVCPPQLPYHIQQKNLILKMFGPTPISYLSGFVTVVLLFPGSAASKYFVSLHFDHLTIKPSIT